MRMPRQSGFFSPFLFFGLAVLPLLTADISEALRHYESGQYSKASDQLAAASRSAPNDATIRFWLGKCYLRLHRWDEAVRELEKSVQLDPARSEYHLWLGRAYGDKASRASIFSAYGWARKVRREFETAVKLAPDNLDARFDLLEFYLQAPGIIGGGKDKAEAEVREISRINARSGHSAGARIHEEAKRWDLARQELEISIRESPREAEGYLDLAEFLFRRHDYAEAESTARAALERNASLAGAKMILAAAAVQQRKNLPEAEKILRAMTSGPLRDGDPSFADVHYWVAQACLAQGKSVETRRALESALRFNPEHSEAKTALQKLR